MRSFRLSLLMAMTLALPAWSAHAQDTTADDTASDTPVWSATGELGLALARGNQRSENLNTRFQISREDARSMYQLGFAALRAKAEVTVVDDAGNSTGFYQTSANRYQFSGTGAVKMDDMRSWFGAARYERDDFALNDQQSTVSVGYGHHFFRNDDTLLLVEIGPGYRRARLADTGEVNSEMIARGLLDFRRRLTGNTQITNTLLVEAGSDNTFAQNDFGLTVSMNQSLALKAGVQLRHNTDVDEAEGVRKTDTLTTVNLVYTFR